MGHLKRKKFDNRRERKRAPLSVVSDTNPLDAARAAGLCYVRDDEPGIRQSLSGVLDDATNPAACFAELYRHFASPHAWRVLPDVTETLGTLVKRRLRLGLASNYDRRLRSVLAGLPELAMIQDVAISSEIGWRKPAREFFEALGRQLGLPPGQMLLVGDDLGNDYEGARAAGLRALLIDPFHCASSVDRIGRLGDLPEWLREYA